MKAIILAAIAITLTIGTDIVLAEQNTPPGDCGAAPLVVENEKFSVTEDGKTTEIKAHAQTNKVKMAAARTTCRSSGGYTVCSNGRHGCVWSDRSGKLLGCGAGI